MNNDKMNNELLIEKLLSSGFVQKGDTFSKGNVTVSEIDIMAFSNRRKVTVKGNEGAFITFNEIYSSPELFDEVMEKAFFFLSDFKWMTDEFMNIQKINQGESLMYLIMRKDLFHKHFFRNQKEECLKAIFQEHFLSKRNFQKYKTVWWRTDIEFSLIRFEARSMKMTIEPTDPLEVRMEILVPIKETYARKAFKSGFSKVRKSVTGLIVHAGLNL